MSFVKICPDVRGVAVDGGAYPTFSASAPIMPRCPDGQELCSVTGSQVLEVAILLRGGGIVRLRATGHHLIGTVSP
jgi:hypothetical protein